MSLLRKEKKTKKMVSYIYSYFFPGPSEPQVAPETKTTKYPPSLLSDITTARHKLRAIDVQKRTAISLLRDITAAKANLRRVEVPPRLMNFLPRDDAVRVLELFFKENSNPKPSEFRKMVLTIRKTT